MYSMQFAGGDMIGRVLRAANSTLPVGSKNANSYFDECTGNVCVVILWIYRDKSVKHLIDFKEIQDDDRLDEIFRAMKAKMRSLVDPYDTDPNLK